VSLLKGHNERHRQHGPGTSHGRHADSPRRRAAGPSEQGVGLRTELLQSYVDTVLFRDVVELRGIAGERSALDRTPLLAQSGCEHERAPIVPGLESAGSWGHALAKDSVRALLAYLIDSYLIARLAACGN
jgi:hypothetical protein